MINVRINQDGYVTDFATIGSISGGIDVPMPDDTLHFADHYTAYMLVDGSLVFDARKAAEVDADTVKDELRIRRRIECFPIVNRGSLWINRLTAEQKAELATWYEEWLDAPDTLAAPDMPEWLIE